MRDDVTHAADPSGAAIGHVRCDHRMDGVERLGHLLDHRLPAMLAHRSVVGHAGEIVCDPGIAHSTPTPGAFYRGTPGPGRGTARGTGKQRLSSILGSPMSGSDLRRCDELRLAAERGSAS